MPVLSVSSFSPAHITGFFSSYFDTDDPLKSGSTGAGFSINRGVRTQVEYLKTSQRNNEVFINNILSDAKVSLKTLELFKSRYNIGADVFYRISHSIEIPMGCGFGTSGAGALSVSMALHQLHEIDAPLDKIAQIAHLAEVQLKTGLGTVTAETYGGMEIRLLPGAPGIAELAFIKYSGYSAAFCVWGPIATSELLQDKKIRERINHFGNEMVNQLKNDPCVSRFMKLSYKFTNKLNIFSINTKKLIEELKNKNILSAMLMFGDGVFVLYQPSQLEVVKGILNKFSDEAEIIYCEIEEKGVRLIDQNRGT
ncbi:MAG: hypothetical protein JXR70_08035 [Spirochaetales bacterium]|nr:hypothetical protein [Spirochaetales bacterium]